MFEVNGKTITVTGASSGIGQAMASHLAKNGANVIAVARREIALSKWAETTNGNVAYVAADLGDIDALESVSKKIASHFGKVDILINAAGLNPRIHADEVTKHTWNKTLDINLNAPFFLAQQMIPAMKEAIRACFRKWHFLWHCKRWRNANDTRNGSSLVKKWYNS